MSRDLLAALDEPSFMLFPGKYPEGRAGRHKLPIGEQPLSGAVRRVQAVSIEIALSRKIPF